MHEQAAKIVYESVDLWNNEFFYFLNVVLVRNLTLRMVRQVYDESIHCRYFCGFNQGKTFQGRALLNSYTFNRINEASWYHLSRLTKRTEGQ